ncbi:hypothetical protein GSI_10556 [Ganoderma sinense ZZ0214-1]|uniref:Uncharacterized protein n=1 Tax=Ganoderma sinense ZZ0214-1 TaxID=1077348 RepID=A0A2G8S1H1_9APHY|nr:hypothetical protein GSI_10556 [Ganoderma sinense ZZ0214-1]
MVYVRSRKFCCCLPVRFGVFCEALIGIAVGGLFAVGGWLQIHSMLKGTLVLSHTQEISLWCLAVSMTIFTLSSLLGFIGAIGRKHSLVSLYGGTITFTTVLSIATGIFFIWNLFHAGGEEQVKKCEQNAQNAQDPSDPNFQQSTTVDNWVCQTGFATGRTVVVVVYVIFWLIQIYGCVIAFNYVSQLEEEEQAQFDHEKPAPQVTIVQPAYAFSERPNYGSGRA